MNLNNLNAFTADGDGHGYKNSETLVEKLRPKLKSGSKPQPAGGASSDVWNDLGVARNNEEVLMREKGYKDFAFNTLVSSRIGIKRSVPDTRHKECKKQVSERLLNVLIILLFYAFFTYLELSICNTMCERKWIYQRLSVKLNPCLDMTGILVILSRARIIFSFQCLTISSRGWLLLYSKHYIIPKYQNFQVTSGSAEPRVT